MLSMPQRESAKQKGIEGWRFTLQAPSYTAVMTYMDDRATRETMYRAFTTRATEGVHDNSGVLARILELRRVKAALLGYRDFADLVLEDRMAKNAERALAFVHELHTKTKDRFDEENAELQAFCRELEGANAPELQPWDIGYYSEKQRQALYDFDEEELRPYFELDTVVNGMFELVQRLYGIRSSGGAGRAWMGSCRQDVHDSRRRRHQSWVVLRGLVSSREQARRRMDGRAAHRRA